MSAEPVTEVPDKRRFTIATITTMMTMIGVGLWVAVLWPPSFDRNVRTPGQHADVAEETRSEPPALATKPVGTAGPRSAEHAHPTQPARAAATPAGAAVNLDLVDAYLHSAPSNPTARASLAERIQGLLAQHQVSARTDIDCRGSICKVRLDVAEPREALKLRKLTPDRTSEFTYEVQTHGRAVTATAYITTPGVTFNEALASAAPAQH